MNIKGQWDKLTKRQKYILKHFAYLGRKTNDWRLYWSYKQEYLSRYESDKTQT